MMPLAPRSLRHNADSGETALKLLLHGRVMTFLIHFYRRKLQSTLASISAKTSSDRILNSHPVCGLHCLFVEEAANRLLDLFSPRRHLQQNLTPSGSCACALRFQAYSPVYRKDPLAPPSTRSSTSRSSRLTFPFSSRAIGRSVSVDHLAFWINNGASCSRNCTRGSF